MAHYQTLSPFGIFPSFLESSTIFRFFFFICIKIGYVSGGEIDSVLPNIPKNWINRE